MVNRTQYEALLTDLQKIIEVAAQAEHDQGIAEANAGNARALQTLIHQHSVQVRQLPPDVMQGLGKASGETISEMRSGGDDLMKRTIGSFLSTHQTMMQWSQVSEQSFLSARALPFDYS